MIQSIKYLYEHANLNPEALNPCKRPGVETCTMKESETQGSLAFPPSSSSQNGKHEVQRETLSQRVK